MVRRGVVVAVTAWLAVVVMGSTMVWAVISRAGQEVVSDASAGPAAASSLTGAPTPRGPSSSASKKPRSHHRGSGSPGSDPSRSTGGSDSTSSSNADPGSAESTRSSGSHSSAPAPVTREGAWSEVGGTVTVACTGSTISSWGVTPDSGWKASPAKHPSELEVKFTASGENDREVEVKATCTGGSPHFHSERSGGSEDDGEGD